MTNEELIECLRCENENYGDCSLHESDCKYRFGIYCAYRQMMLAAADALEAADKRIAELEAQEPTEKQVVDYCHKRCLVIVEEELFQRMKATFSLMPKEGEWIIDGMNEYQLSYGCVGYEPIYRCSKCGITTESYLRTERPIMPEDADFPNYCPNCGAKMRGEHDEQIH